MSRTLDLRTRYHERRYPLRERLAWGAMYGEPLSAGAVLDESRSGIGFITKGRGMPAPGQSIRILTRGPASQSRSARVVRLASLGEEGTVVGCRWTSSGVGHRANRPGPIRLQGRTGRVRLHRPRSTGGGA